MMNINKNRLINTFVEFTKIISPSGKEEKMAQCVIKKLKSLNFKIERDDFGNVIAKKDGNGEAIILCGHLDTVPVGGKKISPIIHDDKITSDGKTILGADNKDSISAIFEALQVLDETKSKHRKIEIVFTKEEETISRGAVSLDYSQLKGKECIISDMSGKYGVITLSAPYCFQFDIEVKGKRCHPKEPEKGVNVSTLMSQAIVNSPIGKIDNYTTATISYQVVGLQGEINKNLKNQTSHIELSIKNRNTIPDLGYVFGEVRGSKIKTVKKTLKQIENNFRKVAKNMGGEIVFNTNKLADGYHFNKKDDLMSLVNNIYKQQNIKPEYVHSIGGSDANIFNGKGIKTIVISSAHRNNHQVTEYLVIDELCKLTDFYIRLLKI